MEDANWSSMWLGLDSLFSMFPNLFVCRIIDLPKVVDLGCWLDEIWVWNLGFEYSSLPADVDQYVIDLLVL